MKSLSVEGSLKVGKESERANGKEEGSGSRNTFNRFPRVVSYPFKPIRDQFPPRHIRSTNLSVAWGHQVLADGQFDLSRFPVGCQSLGSPYPDPLISHAEYENQEKKIKAEVAFQVDLGYVFLEGVVRKYSDPWQKSYSFSTRGESFGRDPASG